MDWGKIVHFLQWPLSVKWVVLTPGTGKRCMAGTGGHIALGLSLPQRQQWPLGRGEGGRRDTRSAPPIYLPKRFGDRHRQGMSGRRHPMQGYSSGYRDICPQKMLLAYPWHQQILPGAWRGGKRDLGIKWAASPWEWGPGFGFVGNACLRTGDGPWWVSPLPAAPLAPLCLHLAGILLFLSFSFQCPAVLVVLGGRKKKKSNLLRSTGWKSFSEPLHNFNQTTILYPIKGGFARGVGGHFAVAFPRGQ